MEIPQPWMARGPLFRQPAVEEIAKDWLWDGGLNMGYHQNRTFKKDTPLDLGASYAQTRKIKKHFQEWNCETHGTSCPHQPTNMCERFLAIVTSKRWHLRGDKGALYHGSMVIYKIIASCPTVGARGPQNEEKNPSFLGGVLYEGAGILHAQSPLCQIPNHLGKSDANSTSYIYIYTQYKNNLYCLVMTLEDSWLQETTAKATSPERNQTEGNQRIGQTIFQIHFWARFIPVSYSYCSSRPPIDKA